MRPPPALTRLEPGRPRRPSRGWASRYSLFVPPNDTSPAKRPVVARPVDADVLRARLHAERVEQAVVVVGIAVALVDGHVELVGAFDEIEAVDRERDLGLAGQPLRVHLLEVRVGAVAADAVGVEQADAEHEVVDRVLRADVKPNRHRRRRCGTRTTAARSCRGARRRTISDLARAPASFGRLEHVAARGIGSVGAGPALAPAGSAAS